MSRASRGFFLCPNCESVAVGQEDGTALCGECGLRFPIAEGAGVAPPGVGKASPTKAVLPAAGLVERNINVRAAPSLPGQAVPEEPEPRGLPVRSYKEVANRHRPNRQKRKRAIKKERNYFKILAIWLSTVAIAGGIAFLVNRVSSERAAKTRSVVENLTGEKRDFFLQEFPGLESQMQGFIRADSREQRENYVFQTPIISRLMARYYRENQPVLPTNFPLPQPTFWNVAYAESPGFVEAGWDYDIGRRIETVFVKVNNEWRLDWEHYVRYNSANWILFRQNLADESEGTFRLFVEKVDEGSISESSWTKVRFYLPLDDEAKRNGSQSKIVKLDGDDRLSTAILETFVDRSVESDGYSKLWKGDPINLRRVNVRLAWEVDESSGEEMLVVKDILAQHWRSLEVTK